MRDIVERLELQAFVADKIQSGMKPLIMDCLEEITRLRDANEKMKYFLRHNVFSEKQFGVYFVCGDSSDKDRNGMPKDIYVCPAYGSDIIYRYKRMDSSAPQW